MDNRAGFLLENWKKRNISGFYCDDKKQAVEKLLGIIPVSARVGISGSVTLDQLEAVKKLESRGNTVFNQYKTGISRQENLELRKQGTMADYYLASANAVSKTGELVFLSAYGNRIAGVANAGNVIIVCGINKITENLSLALKRAREYVTPLNCKRLNWQSACLKDGVCSEGDCFVPAYKRMCCQTLIIESELTPERLKVILVGEELGY